VIGREPPELKTIGFHDCPDVHLPSNLRKVRANGVATIREEFVDTRPMNKKESSCKPPIDIVKISSQKPPDPCDFNTGDLGRSEMTDARQSCIGVTEDMNDPKVNPRKPVGLKRINVFGNDQPLRFGVLDLKIF
jgi:hypothetical protein